jgi:hypothetical protein
MAAVVVATLGVILIVFEYRTFLVSYIIENFLIERKDITKGGINEFYIGMRRSSLIETLKFRMPSSVTPIPNQTFNITTTESEEWAKVDQNASIGVMMASGDELIINLKGGVVKRIKCLSQNEELCRQVHIGDSLNDLKTNIKNDMRHGDIVRVFPVLFDRVKYQSVTDLQSNSYRSLSSYDRWQIRYNIKGIGDEIYDISFTNNLISRIHYERPRVRVGE